MEPVSDRPMFGPAFRFGASAILTVVRENWRVFIVLALVYLVSVLYDRDVFGTIPFAWIGKFVALVTTVRILRGGLWLTSTFVIGWALASLPSMMFEALYAYGPQPHHPTQTVFTYLIAIMLGLWIQTKLDPASALYALQSTERNAVAALAQSWKIVSGGMWWRIAILGTCIGLICNVPTSLLLRLYDQAFRNSPITQLQSTLDAAVSLLVLAGALTYSIWYQSALVALMAAATEEYAPVDSAPGIT